MEGFFKEWQMRLPQLDGKKLQTVYFGGGTPALLGPESIGAILSWMNDLHKDIEVTLEANPENITLDLMRSYADIGINRVSIGIQTLNDNLLHRLGRLHSAEKAVGAVETVRKAGIENISIDLMYDLPGQNVDHWKTTLERVKELPITHLSLYNLTIEPHTVFFKYKQSIEKDLPDPEASLIMYEQAIEVLDNAGLKQYEISAFAKEGFHSRHNVGYWTARPFFGFGPSAFSYWQSSRFRNIAHLGNYAKALERSEFPIDFQETLSEDDHRRELLAVRLRLLEGTPLDKFHKDHGPLEQRDLDALDRLCSQGFVSQEGSCIKLTKQGMLFYDTVAVELI